MKRIRLLVSAFAAIASVVTVVDGADTVRYSKLLELSNFGYVDAPPILKIQTLEQLHAYLAKTDFDTIDPAGIPNFDSVTVIALTYGGRKGSLAIFQDIKTIINDIDTVFVETTITTSPINPSILVDIFDEIRLFTIPKTEKPIILRNTTPAAIIKPAYCFYGKTGMRRIVSKNCDIKGRFLSAGGYKGVIIAIGAYGRKKIIDIK